MSGYYFLNILRQCFDLSTANIHFPKTIFNIIEVEIDIMEMG